MSHHLIQLYARKIIQSLPVEFVVIHYDGHATIHLHPVRDSARMIASCIVTQLSTTSSKGTEEFGLFNLTVYFLVDIMTSKIVGWEIGFLVLPIKDGHYYSSKFYILA